jgi:hypothetical protein
MTEQAEHLVQAFLEKACKKIWSMQTRKSVQLELLDHINAAREHYEQTGLSSNEATKRALADMGDPKALAHLLKRAHTPWRDITTMLIPALGCIFLPIFGALFSGYDLNFLFFSTLTVLVSLAFAVIFYFVGLPKDRPMIAPVILTAVFILFAAARISTTSGLIPRLDLGYTPMFDHLTINVFEIGFCMLLVALADLMSKASWYRTWQKWVIWGTFAGAGCYYLLNYSLPYFLVFSLVFIRMLNVANAPREFINKILFTVTSILSIGGATLWALKDSKLTTVLAHLYAIDPPKYELYRRSFAFLFTNHAATNIAVYLLSAVMLWRYFGIMQAIKNPFGKILAHGLWIKYTISFGWSLLGPFGLVPIPREPLLLPFAQSPSVQFVFSYALLGVLLNICREDRRRIPSAL